jgi:hypothetical protein
MLLERNEMEIWLEYKSASNTNDHFKIICRKTTSKSKNRGAEKI